MGSDATDWPGGCRWCRKRNLARVCNVLGKTDGHDPDSSFSALFSLELPAILRRKINRHYSGPHLRLLRGEPDDDDD